MSRKQKETNRTTLFIDPCARMPILCSKTTANRQPITDQYRQPTVTSGTADLPQLLQRAVRKMERRRRRMKKLTTPGDRKLSSVTSAPTAAMITEGDGNQTHTINTHVSCSASFLFYEFIYF